MLCRVKSVRSALNKYGLFTCEALLVTGMSWNDFLLDTSITTFPCLYKQGSMVYTSEFITLQTKRDIARRSGYRVFPFIVCRGGPQMNSGKSHCQRKLRTVFCTTNSFPGFLSFEIVCVCRKVKSQIDIM